MRIDMSGVYGYKIKELDIEIQKHKMEIAKLEKEKIEFAKKLQVKEKPLKR